MLKVGNDTGVQGYAYDELGRRLETKEGSSTKFYAYFGTETLASQGASGNPTDYVYAEGIRIARVTGYTANNPVATYYHTDSLGSTRLVTSASKTVLFSDSYQPFGQDNGTPSSSETYKFTGKPVSQTTGLYYYYHRWYDPSIGRFISLDPRLGRLSNPQTQNRYTYVANNPLEFTDPSGEFLNIVIGAIAGAIIGYGACVWATGGWTSTQCGIAAGAGAFAGAVAGATFNPALGLAVDAGLTSGSLGAIVVAGAISGAAAGGASYVAQGGLTTASGQKFAWSAQNFALSVGVGALAGAALAGAGYGISRGLSDVGIFSKTDPIDFAPANPNTGWPGGLAETLAHTPDELTPSEWVSSVKGIANDPVTTVSDPQGGLRAYGYDPTGYPVRVVVGKIGGIVTAFRDNAGIPWYES